MSRQDHNSMEDILRTKLAGVQQAPPDSLRRKVEADFFRTRRKRLGFWWFFGGISGVAALVAALLIWPSAPTGDLMNPSGTGGESVVAVEAASTLPVDGESNTMEKSDESSEMNPLDEGLAGEGNDLIDKVLTQKSKDEGGSEESVTSRTTPEPVAQAVPVVFDDSDDQDTDRERIASSSVAVEANPPVEDVVATPDDGLNNAFSTTATQAIDMQDEMLLLPARPALLPAASARNIDEVREYPARADLPHLEEPGTCPKWIIGASGGVGMSYRTLHSNVHHQLVEHKNQSEHASLSASAGIYAVATLLGNSGIKTGFTYLRVGERYHFENDHASHATTNTYEYLNMDLKFNQSLFCNERWRLDVAAGTKLNLLRDAQSSWLDPNSFEAIAHNDEGEHSPFREYNLVWSAELTGYYFISRKAFIGLTIEADRFQNSIYKDAVELNQRPYAFQGYFNIGFRF